MPTFLYSSQRCHNLFFYYECEQRKIGRRDTCLPEGEQPEHVRRSHLGIPKIFPRILTEIQNDLILLALRGFPISIRYDT